MDYRVIKFYEQLKVSSRTKKNYYNALNSSFIKRALQDSFDTDNIFLITDLAKLWDFYCKINLHPTNIANHRGYSCAIMQYIRYLNNGNKVGKRIDANTKRNKRNNK